MRNTIEEAAVILARAFRQGGKLLLCGNGGSAADCAHIAGELAKGFVLPRTPDEALQSAIGEPWAKGLQRGLPAIDLGAHSALITAIANDIAGESIFAQQVMAYGRPGDVLWGLSTSGNAENVRRALVTARALGLTTMGMTGQGGGRMAPLCDLLLDVPERETYLVQQEHLRMYHQLCLQVEAMMYG